MLPSRTCPVTSASSCTLPEPVPEVVRRPGVYSLKYDIVFEQAAVVELDTLLLEGQLENARVECIVTRASTVLQSALIVAEHHWYEHVSACFECCIAAVSFLS